MKYIESFSNLMEEWYGKKEARDLGIKKRVVEENLELALRLYNVFGDREIGLMFIGRYSNTKEYGDSALFVADELSGRLDSDERKAVEDRDPLPKKRFSELIQEELLEIKEARRLLRRMGIGRGVGNGVSAGRFWQENQWDNIVRMREDLD